MGSGIYLNRSIKKHGIENFTKEILHVFDNPEDMFAKEAEIVNADFLAEENTYNLKLGGMGGWDYINATLTPEQLSARGKAGREATNKVLREKLGPNWSMILSRRSTQKLKNLLKEDPNYIRDRTPDVWTGRKHTEDTKQKMRDSHKGKHNGKKNSQYGKMWITNETESRSIKKDSSIPPGWRKGRVIKPK